LAGVDDVRSRHANAFSYRSEIRFACPRLSSAIPQNVSCGERSRNSATGRDFDSIRSGVGIRGANVEAARRRSGSRETTAYFISLPIDAAVSLVARPSIMPSIGAFRRRWIRFRRLDSNSDVFQQLQGTPRCNVWFAPGISARLMAPYCPHPGRRPSRGGRKDRFDGKSRSAPGSRGSRLSFLTGSRCLRLTRGIVARSRTPGNHGA
jgi:hypothetical protein